MDTGQEMREILLAEIEDELLDRARTLGTDAAASDERVQLLRRVREDLLHRELTADLLWFVTDRGERRASESAFEAKAVPV
jgi:hypothetical protein